MWHRVAALRLNSTPVIACYHPFILYLQTFCSVSDCILNENIIIIIIIVAVAHAYCIPSIGKEKFWENFAQELPQFNKVVVNAT